MCVSHELCALILEYMSIQVSVFRAVSQQVVLLVNAQRLGTRSKYCVYIQHSSQG